MRTIVLATFFSEADLAKLSADQQAVWNISGETYCGFSENP
jgi:hypothetical protein